MIIEEEKLKFIDLHTLVEVESPEDETVNRGRPLEWRRSFNNINFEASTFSLDSMHFVNESSHLGGILWSEGQDRNEFFPDIQCAMKNKISVKATVSFESIQDAFYQTVEFDKVGRIFILRPDSVAKTLTLELSEGDPEIKDRRCYKAGSYSGHAWFEDEDQSLYLAVTANKEVLIDLVNAIVSDTLDKVMFNVAISSFSFEVDDFALEPYSRRDLVLHGSSTPAALESVVIRKKRPAAFRSPSSSTESGGQGFSRDTEVSSFKITNLVGPVSDPIDGTVSLKSIKLALWALVVILFFILLK